MRIKDRIGQLESLLAQQLTRPLPVQHLSDAELVEALAQFMDGASSTTAAGAIDDDLREGLQHLLAECEEGPAKGEQTKEEKASSDDGWGVGIESGDDWDQ